MLSSRQIGTYLGTILVAQSRQLQMSDVLAHPLGPLPWAISNGDGTLRKTNKAKLARELEKCNSSGNHAKIFGLHH